MAKSKSVKIVTERVWNAEQSWNLERVMTSGAHKLRLRIRHNAYTDQSYGRIERWNGTEWKTVHHIPGASLEKNAPSYVQGGITARNFSERTIAELVDTALVVIS